MRWAFPYCSSMRLVHVCQQTSIQVQPSCESRSWSSMYGGAGLSPQSCSGINVGFVNAALRAAAMLNQRQQSSCRWGVLGHPGLCRWALGGCVGYCCPVFGWQLCVFISHMTRGLRHSYRTDITFISYTPWCFSGTLESLWKPGACSRPNETWSANSGRTFENSWMNPPNLSRTKLLRSLGNCFELCQFI